MKEHWNIQITIQRVQETPAPVESRGIQQALTGKDRRVTEVLKLAVTADTEQDAYLKAHRMLTANESADPTVNEVLADPSIAVRPR